MNNDDAYALARRTLIEAVQALQEIAPTGIVLVGAHAVYLRAPEPIVSIPAFTYDGDLVVNPHRVVHAALVRERLDAAGFELRGRFAGLYQRRGVPEPQTNAARVDLLVPAGAAYAWSGERYDARATMSQPGLEVCLYDHGPMQVATLEDGGEPFSIDLEVAGVVGLIIAKAWKLGERDANGPDAFAEVYKDVGDVYRLLRVTDRAQTVATLRSLAHEPSVRDCARAGANALRHVLRPGGPGVQALRSMIPPGATADRAARALVALASEFVEDVAAALA